MPAMAAAEVQKTLIEALSALYHSPDSNIRNQANHWLQEFQHSILAWEVSDRLLHDANSNLETLIFCSQTLKTKVKRDFEELPPSAFHPLRDSLYALLKQFSTGPSKVRTQICIAVASLAVHVSQESWGGGGILNWLREEMKSNPDYIPSLLELLAILPQEAFGYKTAARPERRREFQNELVSFIQVVLDLLTYCLNFTKLQEQVMEAFASWLRLNRGIPGSTLAGHPLVVAALSSLQLSPLPDAAVNAICELIRYTISESSGGLTAQMPLIQVLVPHVMGLRDRFKDPSKDEDDVKAMARLFSDMGDSYVDLIASGSDESMLIVQALLDVASHPDNDIASMTFNFWHSLQVSLIDWDSYSSVGSDDVIGAERGRRIAVFSPIYEQLISLISFRVQYPEDYGDFSKEDKRDFKQTRYAVGDVLIDAASVLGGATVVKILFVSLVKAMASCDSGNSWDWRATEAVLYCIQAVGSSVLPTEHEIMPQVFALLPKLPHQPPLLQTTCLTIGAYSTWLSACSVALPFLPSVIDILTRGMTTSEESAETACMAFRHVCDACRVKLCGSIDGLFHIYHKAVNGEGGYKVCTEDSLQLVEALSVVITELSLDKAKRALEALCVPAVNTLQGIINQGTESIKQLNPTQFTIHVDRLANIFRYVNHPEAVGDAFERIWPLFKSIFEHCAWDMRIMEALCRACKYAVRTSGKFIVVTIGEMLSVVQGQYQLHHQPCFLYLSSEVIKLFGSDPSCANYLGCLIESLFHHTTHLLTKVEDFTARPDIADDCFLLASRCIRYCPHIFVSSPVFSRLVDCSIIGITVQHREACNSILTFLSDVFNLGRSVNEEFRCVAENVIVPRGSSITRILLASVTGALPTSRLEEVSYAMYTLASAYGDKVCVWANEALSLLPSAAVTGSERAMFLNALSSMASSGDSSSLIGPVKEFSDVCRRNRAVQDSVQGALRPHELNLVSVS